MINIPVLPSRQLIFLYHFHIQIYIGIKISYQIISYLYHDTDILYRYPTKVSY